MIPDCFLDTNILFYAAMGRFSAPDKYRKARELIANNHFGISGQVLAEFYVNVTRKGDTPLGREEALGWLNDLMDRPCAAIDHEIVVNAVRISDRYAISYWDAAIIASAERIGAKIVYSEDLNNGQFYGSVQVINPFIA